MEAAGVPVDAADVEVQVQLGEFLHKAVVDLGSQSHGGLVEILQVVAFVLREPGPVVIEADAPQEVQGFVAVASKHKCNKPPPAETDTDFLPVNQTNQSVYQYGRA